MAQLHASDAPIPLSDATVSGDTVVASGSAYLGGHVRQVVYVFTRPAGGWSDTPKPTAMLVASDGGDVVGPVALSGQTVVAAAGSGRAYVFTEPAGGWSGTVHESAQLTASDASTSGGLHTWAIDGRTIVVGSFGSSSSPGEAYVFTEPAQGWSGKLHESAKLFASSGVDGDGFGSSVAISGQTIAVGAPHANAAPGHVGGRVYVFTEPASGWSGMLHESAILSASSSDVSLAGPVAVVGNSVFGTGYVPVAVAEIYVFAEPAGGWTGSLDETAVLSTSDGAYVPTLAASGNTLLAGNYLFTEPAGGWVNATETAKLTPAQGSGIDGQTVVGASGPAVSVFVEPSGGWSSSVQPTATLSLTGASGQILFESAGMSDGVAVAGAPFATVGANQNQGAVYVFTEPAGGWSSETESAKLVESDGRAGDYFGGLVATSGGTVVVGCSAAQGSALCVFTEPAGGWSGTVQETAQLITTQPTPCGPQALAISGDTIVAGGCTFSPTAYVVDVFTRPPGGWSGAIHQSAKLTTPTSDRRCFIGQGGVAKDAQTIAVACQSAVYVFTEPAAGWTGTINPSATLPVPPNQEVGSVAILGSSIVEGLTGNTYPTDPVVFDKPASGWAGTIRPAATLTVSGDPGHAVIQSLVGSGNAIATVAMPEGSSECFPGALSCNATLSAFSEPPGGWKGTIAGSSTPIGASAFTFPLAIDGPTIATGGVDTIDLFTLFTRRPGAPSVHNAALSGIATGTPKLRFTLNAGLDAAPIRSFKLTLPDGLRFAGQRPGRTAGIHINAPFRTVRARPDTDTFTLRPAARNLAVTITRPAIIEHKNLIAKVRRIRIYNRTHRRKRAVTLRLHCVVTDATSHSTLLALTTRIS